MIWAAALTRADVGDFMVETQGLDTKLVGAYTLVMKLMRVRGSLSTDEKELARIARCTRGYWTKTVWPKIEHMFDRRGDRLYHPELEEIPPEIRRQASARAAANARWNRPQLVSDNGPSAPPSHDAAASNPHDAAACDPHTQNAAISMPVAFGPHAFPHSDASPRAGAPSLSLQDSSLSESLQNLRESLGEREGAGARGHAPGHAFSNAPHDAPASKPHDADACDPHTQNPTISTPVSSGRHRRTSRRAAPSTPIPPDWKPTEVGKREARKRGYDPDDIVPEFVDYYRANGEMKADWDACWVNWLRREHSFSGDRKQRKMVMGLPSASPAPAPDRSEADTVLLDPLKKLTTRYFTTGHSGPKPPSEAVFRAECEHGRAATAATWVAWMDRWIAGGRLGDRPPEFLDYVRDPVAYDETG